MQEVQDHCFYKSPVGWLQISASLKGVTSISFLKEAPVTVPTVRSSHLKETYKQLNEYFSGERLKFKLPLDLEGTPFQQDVWQALCKIPFGSTVSYKEIAEKVGSPKGARAVGMANNRNPLPIVIPCHRVIGASGELVGFAPGVEVKEHLLNHEGYKHS